MAVIAGHTPPGSTDVDYIAAVKGAPETLRTMVCKAYICWSKHCIWCYIGKFSYNILFRITKRLSRYSYNYYK